MSGQATSSGEVRQVAVPADARMLSTLSRIDYSDAHLVDTVRARDRTAEDWVRAILAGAPNHVRRTLRSGWASLGIQLGPADDPELVLGWEVRRSAPDFALLTAAGARLGLHGEVLMMRRERSLLLATFVQLGNPAARAVWTGVAPGHRQVVRHVLGSGVRHAAVDG